MTPSQTEGRARERPAAPPSPPAPDTPAQEQRAQTRARARARARRASPQTHRRGTPRLKDAVLLVAGTLGLLGLVWVLVSPLLGLSVVTFRTGSMAPEIPTGAGAVVQQTAASDLVVGDVVTVMRGPDAIPVTHRIVQIDAGVASGDRVLVLQGDANERPDAQPYTVSEVRRVLFAVPGLGTAVMVAQTPLALGVGTLLAAGLVLWAFLPERGREQ